MIIIQKAWGFEKVIVNNPLYCGKELHLDLYGLSSLHYHRKKLETFYILSGLVRLTIDIQSRAANPNPQRSVKIMKPGQSVDIFPMYAHRFYGIDHSVIMEFSTYHDEEDVVRLLPSMAGDPLRKDCDLAPV